jgi:hypothetical protein
VDARDARGALEEFLRESDGGWYSLAWMTRVAGGNIVATLEALADWHRAGRVMCGEADKVPVWRSGAGSLVNLSCPGCGAEMTLDVLIAHDGAREAVLLALQLPAPLGKLLVQYLSLFRPAKRQLSWARVGAILGELREPIAPPRSAQRPHVAGAARVLARRARADGAAARPGEAALPLKSHGYLLEVIVGMSDKAEAGESAREDARRGVAGHAPASFKAAPPQGRR